jgi:hypothetical protein
MVETLDQAERKSARWLWIDLLVGPVVWAVHFVIVYMLVEITCLGGQIPFSLIERTPLILTIAVLTLAALGLVGWRGLAAFRTWRGHPTRQGEGLRAENWADDERTPFMGLAGFLLSAFFTLTILLVVMPFLLLRPCGGAGS